MKSPQKKPAIDDLYPLTPLQRGMLFHSLFDPESPVYFEQFHCELVGPLNENAFKEAWQEMTCRHEVLRTAFVTKGQKEPLQAVYHEVQIPWILEDWRQLNAEDENNRLLSFLELDRKNGFPLNRAPLMRMALLRVNEERWHFVWSHHHILMDGWSLPILLRDFFASYTAFAEEQTARFPPHRSYGDFVEWVNRQQTENARQFWKNHLEGLSEPTLLIGDRTPSSDQGLFAEAAAELAPAATEKLRGFALQQNVTLNTLVQAAWALLLSRYLRTQDVVFGMTVSGRPPEFRGAENMVGLFINTIPLRLQIQPEMQVADWLREVQQIHLSRQEFELTSLSDIQQWCSTNGARTLFDTLVVFENYPMGDVTTQAFAGIQVENVTFIERTNFPATLIVLPQNSLRFKLSYDSSCLNHRDAKRLANRLPVLLNQMMDEEKTLSSISLSASEEHQPVDQTPKIPPSPAATLHEWFEKIVLDHSHSPAISFANSTLSYAELNSRANRLARYLIQKGVGSSGFIGIYMDRCEDLPTIILAILKAGCAYLPLDPVYPEERLKYIMEDSGVELILTDGRALSGTDVTFIDLPSITVELAAFEDSNLDLPIESSAAAYVIYTSGSTGLPKGCVIEHRNVTRLFTATAHWFSFHSNDVWTLFHSHAFDFSVWEIWGALLYGGRLVIVPFETSRTPEAMLRLLQEEQVTVLNQTPSAFRQLAAVILEKTSPVSLSLRYVIFGGEMLDPILLLPWMERFGADQPQLINMYGITETTVHVTYRRLHLTDIHAKAKSVIGVPIPDLQLHLYDEFNHPCPLGMSGEFFVSGSGLARGYLRRPELNEARFIERTMEDGSRQRLYRTGDLGRQLDSGEFEYLGRADDQVKIRGFRIELREIEAVLTQCSNIREAVVLVKGDGVDKLLAGYVTPIAQDLIELEKVRQELSRRLPDYMIPSEWAVLESLPITANGKLNRHALAQLEMQRAASHGYVAPRNETERILAEIFQEVLGCERVGIHDSYFNLGGDSIRSIRVRSLAAEKGLSFRLHDLFTYPSVAMLSEFIEGNHHSIQKPETAVKPFELINIKDHAALDAIDAWPLTELQKGMLFHSEYEQGSEAYLDVFSHHLRIAIDREKLTNACKAVVSRHPMLRSSIHLSGFSEPLQLVHQNAPARVYYEDLQTLAPAAQDARISEWIHKEGHRPFNLTEPSLIRFGIHRLDENSVQFTLGFHHAILDGWSVALLTAEIFETYQASFKKLSTPSPELPTFGTYVKLEREAAENDLSRSFWKTELEGFLFTELPRCGESSTSHHQEIPVPVGPELSHGLQSFAHRLKVPVKSLLLAAHLRVLSLLSNRQDVTTGVVVHGRPECDGGEQMIGLFLNTLPFRMNLHGMSWKELILSIHEKERTILQHRHYPLRNIQKEKQGAVLFETDFNFVNFHIHEKMHRDENLEYLGGQQIEQTHFILAANFAQLVGSKEISCKLSVDAGILGEDLARRMGEYYVCALRLIANHGQASCMADPLLANRELLELNTLGSGPKIVHPFTPVHEVVRQQALKNPSNPAIHFKNTCLSYDDLEKRANQLAHYLRRYGAGPDVPVGLCMDRCMDLVVALTGILKSGSAYVPIDPDYPPDRITYMMADSGMKLLVTEKGLVPQRMAGGARFIHMASEAELIQKESDTPPEFSLLPENLAYLLYTSGSTGLPKGIAIPQRALANHMAWMAREFPLQPSDRVFQKTPYSFDASVWEFWAPLMQGAQLVIARPGGQQDPDYLIETMRDKKITIFQAVPTLLDAVAGQSTFSECHDLRIVFAGGEALHGKLCNQIFTRLPHCEVVNLYGPTEVTIDATFHRCTREDARQTTIPIGRPVDNTWAFVLDASGSPTPRGVEGELYLVGESVARGYWQRPDLTAQRFVANLSPAGNNFPTMFRTGDLVRWNEAGLLEYLGRVDRQIKLRGFRIELEEIEQVLANLPEVREVAVVLNQSDFSTPRLVAYIVQTDDAAKEWRTLASQHLPEHMLPSTWVMLPDALPRTPSGKIDRSALPAPGETDIAAVSRPYREPRTPQEKNLASVFSQLLRIERVGSDDNFFELGGDSILSLQATAQMARLGWKIHPRTIFEQQTVSAIAHQAQPLDVTRQTQHVRAGNVPLTPIQREFFEWNPSVPNHWNQSLLLKTFSDFPANRLRASLEKILRQHDVFYLHFENDVSETCAEYGAFIEPVVETMEAPVFTENSKRLEWLEKLAGQTQAGLNLASGPVVRALHISNFFQQEGRLLIVAHHLYVDAVSWNILLDELDQCLKSETETLLPTALDFGEWARGLELLAQQPAVENDFSQWTDILRNASPHIPVDADSVSETVDESGLEIHISTWNEQETHSLARATPSRNAPRPDELILAALSEVFAEADVAELLVNLESHGRDVPMHDLDASRTVGWFTSIYPIRLQHDASLDARARLKKICQSVRALPSKGFSFSLLRHSSHKENIRRELASLPQPRICLNYLGQLDASAHEARLFAPANESAGQDHATGSRRQHWIDIIAFISNGELKIQWLYSPKLHRRETIEQWAYRLTKALKEIVHLCTGDDKPGYVPADFSTARLDQSALDAITQQHPHVEDIYALSPLQEGMVFHVLDNSDAGLYVQQLFLDISGEFNLSGFEKAWKATLLRHPALRSAFVWEGVEYPVQLTMPIDQLPWHTLDWQEKQNSQIEKDWEALLAEDRALGFKLDQTPLMRLTIVQLGVAQWRFLWSHHHLLLDGWSVPIVLKDVLGFYREITLGETHQSPSSISYSRFVEWLQRQDSEAAKSYWTEALRGISEPALLTDAFRTPVIPGTKPRMETDLLLDELKTTAVVDAAKQHRVTLSVMLQAAWGLTASRITGERSSLFGVITSGRPPELHGSENAVGLFINTLPLHLQINPNKTTVEYLQQVHEQAGQMAEHQHSRLVDIQGWSDVPRDRILFDHIMVFENYPVDESLRHAPIAGLQLGTVQSVEATNYPVALYVEPGKCLKLKLVYDSKKISLEDARQCLESLSYVLMALAEPQPRLLSTISLASQNSHHTHKDNDAIDAPNFIDLFAKQVALRPDDLAVECQGHSLTYRELNAQSDQMANLLFQQGVGIEKPVALCLERNLHMMVALLGILKTGAPYLPIDPAFPIQRITWMLEDGHCEFAITEDQTDHLLEDKTIKRFRLNPDRTLIKEIPLSFTPVTLHPESLAYMIFTSGSTGRPKGVQIPHRAVSNLLATWAQKPGLKPGETLVTVTTLSFDISVLELFLPLVVGAQVVIATREIASDGLLLASLLQKHRANVLQATPATWKLLLEAGWEPSAGLRMWCGGEAMPQDLARQLLRGQGELWNVYGPTETTVWSLIHKVQKSEDAYSIGWPIGSTTTAIVDEFLHPQPTGVAGELLIGGLGVARGYRGHPEWTAEKFIPDPFSSTPGERLYRTGDRARITVDGSVEFLGRRDHQIKVRGYRVEVEDIEATLRRNDIIQDVAVVLQAGERLTAFCVASSKNLIPDIRALRKACAQELPYYMVPSRIEFIHSLPLTPNGKIDRKTLIQRETSEEHGIAHEPAANNMERLLVFFWSEVLKQPATNCASNFFELGGHSLSAMQVVARLRKIFRTDIQVKDLFECPTIHLLSQRLRARYDQSETYERIASTFLKLQAMTPEEKAHLHEQRKNRESTH